MSKVHMLIDANEALDRETVITHLQIIHTWAEFARERDLQFFTAKHLEDIAKWADDALSLLKEQEAVVPINSYGTFRCGNCRNIVGYNDSHGRGYQNNFCSKCGKAVSWNDR